MSGKTDFRTRKIIKDREEHYIMIKVFILQKDINFMCVSNNRALKLLRQKQNYKEKDTNPLL